MLRIKVIGKRKREMRIQPAVVGVPAFPALANVHHGPPLGFCNGIILVITTIVKRYIDFPRRRPCPSTNSLYLRHLHRSVGQFPAAPPLVYSDKESAATAPRRPRIFQWIPHCLPRRRESQRVPPRPAKR